MDESSQLGIPEMARWLEERQNRHHTVLLLGARAGQLFRSEQFYERLLPFSHPNFQQLSQFTRFEKSYSILASDRFSEMDLHNILNTSLKTLTITETNKCLALLIKDQFFHEIISTNIDDGLEETLSHIDFKENRDYRVTRIEDHIASHNHKSIKCRLIKPFGDLVSLNYVIRERRTHLEHPELKSLLQNLLQQDLVILGLDPTWDSDILQLIPTQSSSNLWFVSEEDDIVEKSKSLQDLLSARNASQILGREGNHEYFLQGLHHYLYRGVSPSYQSTTDVQAIQRIIRHEIAAIVNRFPIISNTLPPFNAIAPNIEQSTSISEILPNQADVLLVTVTEIETSEVLQTFKEKCGHTYERRFVNKKTYYELGIINSARIFLVQSEMGVSGTGSSLLTVHKGIQALRPFSVIMVGTAFGVDPHKQKIGDILISQQLRGYELQRYGTAHDGTPRIISRGDRVTASAQLLDRFRSGFFDWSEHPYQSRRGRWGKHIQFGTILSGEKLVDSINFRDQLRTLEPEAIGGEMEGVGLYSAAQNEKVDWILVKGICDWADGNKADNGTSKISAQNGNNATKKTSNQDRDQKVAAKNAAEYVVHVLYTTKFV